jgi:hypothetical protein
MFLNILHGFKMTVARKFLPEIDFAKLSKTAHGINVPLFKKVISFLKKNLSDKEETRFIFFSQIPDIADSLEATTDETLKSFLFFSNKYPKYVKPVAIYYSENLVYHLEPEDLEEVKATNSFHHPDNPKIIISDADKHIRHAFLFRSLNETK